ncbi:MAG: DUF6364 family protein [Deltaproteobacteria bacterium]|nr:DUF6364 family protein [Deltaproteobacteria bacterium]
MSFSKRGFKELVKRAREYAAQHGTSLNQIIREYMEQFSSMSNVEKNAGEFAKKSIHTVVSTITIMKCVPCERRPDLPPNEFFPLIPRAWTEIHV